MAGLNVLTPTANERVSEFGFKVSGQAEGALVTVYFYVLVPPIAQPGVIQKQVQEKKMVASFPTITVTLEGPLGTDVITQSMEAQPIVGLTCSFSFDMEPKWVGETTVTVVSDVPGSSEASHKFKVDVFDPRALQPPKS